MTARATFRPALLAACSLLSVALACGQAGEEPLTLAEASAKTHFGSVEQLGPHRARVRIERTDLRASGATHSVSEEVEQTWQDWDHFQVRRSVDGKVERETLVFDGVAYVREGERWEARADAEPHRVQLRTTWNAWEGVLGSHLEHMELVPEGGDTTAGRETERLRVQMKPPEQRPPPASFGFLPETIEGTVWVDAATAVRLKADVTAGSRRQELQRTVHLVIEYSDVGADLGLQAP